MTEGTRPLPTISMEGATAILIDVAGPGFDELGQARLLALRTPLQAIEGVEETVPGMNNLMLTFNPLQLDPEHLESRILALWQTAEPDRDAGRLVEVPVVYGGVTGEDLIWLAAEKAMTPEELVARHSAPVYRVAAVGAMPGFVYLSGLDPVLAMPRRATPRMAVRRGSVIIGGHQAGIMPITAPSGWHCLGHTDIALFDPLRAEPATFRPGDRIRFVPVGSLR